MSTKLIRTTMAAAFFGLAGSAWAQGPYYQSVQNGNWGTNGTWQQRPTEDDTWAAASEPPGCGDIVQVSHDVTVNAQQYVTTLTVDAGDKVDIDANGIMTLCGTTPSITINGTDGVRLTAASSALRVEVSASLSGAGNLVGLDDSASIQIGTANGSSAVTFTSTGNIKGQLVIKRHASNGSAVGNFYNNAGLVEANVASGTLKLDSSLNSITDAAGSCGSPQWKVATSQAILRFDKAATGLAGYFHVGVGTAGSNPATLSIFANVTTSGLLKFMHNGRVAPTSASFSVTGSSGIGTDNRYCDPSDCSSASLPFSSQTDCS